MMEASWFWVLAASALAFVTKLLGYLVPAHWLQGPLIARVAGAMTVGLLAALVTVNAVADGTHLVLDARLGALVVAALALMLRAPFLVVVLAGAATAAALRWWAG